MRKIVKEMVRIVKKGGKVCVVELSTEARNVAEENYIRLHRESGDSLFDRHEITEAFKSAGLSGVKIEKLESAIWLSPNVAKQDLSLAQVWFDEEVKSRLESSIDKYGMKFPALLAFLGVKLDTIR
jgi:ubiquinone/menaquinone biosynthesis C-methylase UbiE